MAKKTKNSPNTPIGLTDEELDKVQGVGDADLVHATAQMDLEAIREWKPRNDEPPKKFYQVKGGIPIKNPNVELLNRTIGTRMLTPPQ